MKRRILIDECLPQALRKHFPDDDAVTVAYAGFAGLKNGELLRAAESAGFDIFVTGDRSLEYEQNLGGKKLAVVALSANSWNIIRRHIPAIVVAVGAAQSGKVVRAEFGTFSRPKRVPGPSQG